MLILTRRAGQSVAIEHSSVVTLLAAGIESAEFRIEHGTPPRPRVVSLRAGEAATVADDVVMIFIGSRPPAVRLGFESPNTDRIRRPD